MLLTRRSFLVIAFCLFLSNVLSAQTRTIHVYVALCDNVYQGIVPVPEKLGNGQDPRNNLYWGAAYGVKSYFRYKDDDWEMVKTIECSNSNILERILFKHVSEDIYMLAEAYDGKKIKECITDFLVSSNNQNNIQIAYEEHKLDFGGGVDLIAYVGHDGLMDFSLNPVYTLNKNPKDAIILACLSKNHFASHMKKAGANPILWTTHLMAPEAYTLEAAIDGWILQESGEEIEERAAQAYNKYQKCGIKGARNLFTTGY